MSAICKGCGGIGIDEEFGLCLDCVALIFGYEVVREHRGSVMPVELPSLCPDCYRVDCRCMEMREGAA